MFECVLQLLQVSLTKYSWSNSLQVESLLAPAPLRANASIFFFHLTYPSLKFFHFLFSSYSRVENTICNEISNAHPHAEVGPYVSILNSMSAK